MNTTDHLPQQKTVALALGLVLFASLYRVIAGAYLTSLPNFSPTMAMAFCCGLALPGTFAFSVPLICLLISDFLLNAHFGAPLFDPVLVGVYACYGFAILLGRGLRRAGLVAIVAATVFDSVFFYTVTNSLSWVHNPHYAQNFAGWVQALTAGQPGFPPTWVFFRNSLVSDLLFTAAFLLMFSLARRQEASRAQLRPAS